MRNKRKFVPEKNWVDQLSEALIGYYPPLQTEQAARVLASAIVPDFKKILEESFPGLSVNEDYNTQDGKTTIHVEGEKKIHHGRVIFIIRKISIGKRDISFDELDDGEEGLII
jgi:hypothetical protein